ncbi:hypothetical protein TgHK011_007689 [Trichoderma gracile]|nr:hypothetical protein TgHK011_007689 [Trichoderma gracile]
MFPASSECGFSVVSRRRARPLFRDLARFLMLLAMLSESRINLGLRVCYHPQKPFVPASLRELHTRTYCTKRQSGRNGPYRAASGRSHRLGPRSHHQLL